jgi:hypothetical protein
MIYVLEMSSGAMIDIPSSIKISPEIQKIIWGIHGHAESMEIA